MTTHSNLASLIDHTILRADATSTEVEKLCHEALRYNFASVCVNGSRVHQAASLLRGSAVKVCTVIGFPLGAMSTAAKVAESEIALSDGASELDMVINLGWLKDGDLDAVRNDIAAVATVAHRGSAILKVIIETALLSDDEKRTACRLAVEAGCDFVKTSTGFAPSGATTADVALMRQAVGSSIGVKASGGIRTAHDLQAMVAAGASRVGASASVKIIEESGL